MMKFKSSSARTKFKFKNKSATRVKFRAHTVFTKAVSPKRICLATYLKHRLCIQNCEFKLLKNSREAKFKISPPSGKGLKRCVAHH